MLYNNRLKLLKCFNVLVYVCANPFSQKEIQVSSSKEDILL